MQLLEMLFEIWGGQPILWIYLFLMAAQIIGLIIAARRNMEAVWIGTAGLSLFSLVAAVLALCMGDAWKIGIPSAIAVLPFGIMLMLTLNVRANQETQTASAIPWSVLNVISHCVFFAAIIILIFRAVN